MLRRHRVEHVRETNRRWPEFPALRPAARAATGMPVRGSMTCRVIVAQRAAGETAPALNTETDMERTILMLVLIAFSALTVEALLQHGYWGIFEPHFQSFGGAQVFADLVIALSLFMAWMWRDAKAHGRNPWPWLALTLATGSFGPLLYLLGRKPAAKA
jgi:hypothetical protein